MAPVADSAWRSTPGARAARLSAAITACLWLAGCGTPVIAPKLDPNNIPDAVPGDEPRSRYGNPASYEVFGKRYYTLRSSKGYVERGIASWYGDPFHGERTSSGETYDMYRMTAAHKLLPLPTYVLVKNLENGRSATVKVSSSVAGSSLPALNFSASSERVSAASEAGEPGADHADAHAREVAGRNRDGF